MAKSNTRISLRRATTDDAAAIALVLHEAFVEYEAIYTPEGFAATTPTSVQIQLRMSEGPIWVALYENTLMGTASSRVSEPWW